MVYFPFTFEDPNEKFSRNIVTDLETDVLNFGRDILVYSENFFLRSPIFAIFKYVFTYNLTTPKWFWSTFAARE